MVEIATQTAGRRVALSPRTSFSQNAAAPAAGSALPPVFPSTAVESTRKWRHHPSGERTQQPAAVDGHGPATPVLTRPYVLSGEQHRLQIDLLGRVLPSYGVEVSSAGRGLSGLTALLQQRPSDGLMMVHPTRGLLAAVQNQLPAMRDRPLVVIVASEPSRFYLRDVLRVRPRAVISACEPIANIVDALHAVERGERFVSTRLDNEIGVDKQGGLRLQPRTDLLTLTGRQLEVVRLTAIGCSTKDISERLGLATKTVESHRYRAMRKLGLHDRVELTRRSLAEGLLR